ncbi:unnamed protein product [Lymnaea stagnalis]|uniref:SH3 domain-containing protein n=1 Tax=Lymnaea stagnalis TaxID=6523 RepID=A0AAV2HAU1_LYMST
MSSYDAGENVGGAPLPPARNRTKPTVIRPGVKANDSTSSQPTPQRPAPPTPGSRPPPPQRQSEQIKPARPGISQSSTVTAGSVNGSNNTIKSNASGKKRLEITIVDARPMSEMGFRDVKGGAASPTVATSAQSTGPADKNETNSVSVSRSDQEGPPKPKRPSVNQSPASLKQDSQDPLPPPKPARPSVFLPDTKKPEDESQNLIDFDTSGLEEVKARSTDPTILPKPMRPTIIRPQSRLQTNKDQGSPPSLPSSAPKSMPPPPSRPNLPLPTSSPTAPLIPATPPQSSPTPRPRSTFVAPSEGNSSSVSSLEEIKVVPKPLPRPTSRHPGDVTSTSNKNLSIGTPSIKTDSESSKTLSGKSSNAPDETPAHKLKLSSPSDPPPRPKRPSAPSKKSHQQTPHVAAAKPTVPKDDFNDVGPVYAQIVKPPKADHGEATLETKTGHDSPFQVKLRSTVESTPGIAGADGKAERSSQPPVSPKSKPSLYPSLSSMEKQEDDHSEVKGSEIDSNQVVLRPELRKSSDSSPQEADASKPKHISGAFLARFEQSSDNSDGSHQKPTPPVPSKRPITFIGGQNKGSQESSDLPTMQKREEKVPPPEKAQAPPEKAQTPPEKFNTPLEKAQTPLVSHKLSQDKTSPQDVPSSPIRPKRPGAGPPPRPESAAPIKKQPSFSSQDKESGQSSSGVELRRPARPSAASTQQLKPGAPALPGRPGPGHPLYHYMTRQPHGVALHDYKASQPDELTFKEGDLVILLRKESDHWLVGQVGSKEGLFPANYVAIKCPLSGEKTDWKTTLDAWPIGTDEASSLGEEKLDRLQGPRCRARFDFEGEGAGELALEDGDVIELKARVGSEWLRGELRGRQGIFPSSFVEVIEDLPPDDNITTTHVSAIFDFDGQDGELTFQAGDSINILSQVNIEWLYGECHGKRGQFPTSFVSHIPPNLPEYKKAPKKPLVGAAQGKKPREIQGRQADIIPQPKIDAVVPETTPEPEAEGPVFILKSKETVVGYCRGRFDYLEPPLGDLAFKAGDRIEILEFIGEDWARGRLGKKTGMFPLSFVAEEVLDPSFEEPQPEPEVKPKVYGRVVHDFNGETENDLTIKEGDVLEMEDIADTKGNWRWGVLNGKRGMFPVVFVEAM